MFRFGLKTIVLLGVLFPVCLSLGIWIYRSNQQRATVQWIEDHDGSVLYGFQTNNGGSSGHRKSYPKHTPKLLIDWLGYDYFCNVTDVKLDSTKSTISLADSQLDFLWNLKRITIENRGVTGFEKLKNLVYLEEVSIPWSKIPSVSTLKNAQNLQKLVVESIDKKSISEIGKLQNLKTLCIQNCRSVDNYKFLSSLKNLESLTLYRCNGFDFKAISGLPNLKQVDVQGKNSVIGQSLPPNLVTLVLNDPTVSNLKFLNHSPHLESICFVDLSLNSFLETLDIPNLRSIEFYDCTIDSFDGLAIYKKIQTVSISNCVIKDTSSVKELWRVKELSLYISTPNNFPCNQLKHFQLLEQISIDIRIPFDVSILKHLPNLRRARLRFNSGTIDDDALLSLIKHNPNLSIKTGI